MKISSGVKKALEVLGDELKNEIYQIKEMLKDNEDGIYQFGVGCMTSDLLVTKYHDEIESINLMEELFPI